jgi:N-acetyl-anhydromuramyl-L-alanine amidase AmpD
MDSYFVRMEDPKEIKVGEKVVFWGECGLGIAGITLTVDGFEIGKASLLETADGLKMGYRTWNLAYTFKGAGAARSLQVLANDLKGSASYVCKRSQEIKVEPAKEEGKPSEPVKKKFPVTIVESKVRHVTRWDMECESLLIHYTAGRQIADPTGSINMANDPDHSAYCYWVMASDGIVYKTHELNRGGYHSGTFHHRTYLGIEVMCPGRLTKFENNWYPWYNIDRSGIPKGDPWPEDQIRYFKGNSTQIEGHYAKYTEAQEAALVGLVQYLKDNCPKFSIDKIRGHDTACFEAGYPGAKNDPGGSLSMSIPDYIKYLKTVIV